MNVGEQVSLDSSRESPRVFVTYSHDTPQHKDMVRRFATFLREKAGVDVHLDLWYDTERRYWSRWAVDQLTRADYILVVASPEYQRRADGFAPSGQGRGAQFEAAMLRNDLTKDLAAATRRILPVVLPGRSIDEIPLFLNPYSTTHYVIENFTLAAIADLLVALTGQSQHPMPALGSFVGSPFAGTTVPQPQTPAAGPLPHKARLLTTILEPVLRGPDLSFGGADLDAEHYGNSIVHQCAVLCGDPRSAVEYNLARRYHAFETVVGVLDNAAEVNQIGCFQVFLDNRPQKLVQVRHGEPLRIHYDLTRVLRMRLVAYRPDTVGNSLLAGAIAVVGQSRRLPELAWGDPTLFE